jgi:hypothetical protein
MLTYFKFYNIRGKEWLTMELLATDIASAVKDFNLLWGTGMRYEVSECK